MNDERNNLGCALLAIASELTAARHRRAQIEGEEIVYRSATHPLLQAGVSLEYLAELIRQGKVAKEIKVWRVVKNPSREAELQGEAARLDERIAELTELQCYIEAELEAMQTGMSHAQ
jgi:hypothetical protein